MSTGFQITEDKIKESYKELNSELKDAFNREDVKSLMEKEANDVTNRYSRVKWILQHSKNESLKNIFVDILNNHEMNFYVKGGQCTFYLNKDRNKALSFATHKKPAQKLTVFDGKAIDGDAPNPDEAQPAGPQKHTDPHDAPPAGPRKTYANMEDEYSSPAPKLQTWDNDVVETDGDDEREVRKVSRQKQHKGIKDNKYLEQQQYVEDLLAQISLAEQRIQEMEKVDKEQKKKITLQKNLLEEARTAITQQYEGDTTESESLDDAGYETARSKFDSNATSRQESPQPEKDAPVIAPSTTNVTELTAQVVATAKDTTVSLPKDIDESYLMDAKEVKMRDEVASKFQQRTGRNPNIRTTLYPVNLEHILRRLEIPTSYDDLVHVSTTFVEPDLRNLTLIDPFA